MTLKRAKVVMLSSNQKVTNGDGLLLGNNNLIKPITGAEYRKLTYLGFVPQHFYFLSDEEIKEGDAPIWCMNKNKDTVYLIEHITGFESENWDKIIATTNKSLGLPEPSKSFLEIFVRKYNKGNIITEVMVEYNEGRHIPGIVDCGDEDLWESDYYEPDILKVNPKDNTITIKPIKDSWSRDEVKLLCNKAMCYVRNNKPNISLDELHEWIEQNI